MPAIRDAQLTFSDAQDISGGTSGTGVASTNVIDLYDLMHRIGQSARKISIRVDCVTSFNNITSEAFEIEDSADNSTFTSTGISVSILLASLVAGNTLMDIPFPRTGPNGTIGPLEKPGTGGSPIRRYIRLLYTPTFTTAATTGAVTAFLSVEA